MNRKRLEVPVKGMDCADCAAHVEHALAALPGVGHVQVYLAAEKAVLQLDPEQVVWKDIQTAVAGAGYSVPEQDEDGSAAPEEPQAADLCPSGDDPGGGGGGGDSSFWWSWGNGWDCSTKSPRTCPGILACR